MIFLTFLNTKMQYTVNLKKNLYMNIQILYCTL